MGDGESARRRFARRLNELFDAAGNPTLEQVVRKTGKDRPGTTRKVASIGVISSWRSGQHVPAKFVSLEPILVTLRSMARERGAGDSTTMGKWQQLWQAARDNPAGAESVSGHQVVDTLPRDTTVIGRDDELERIAKGVESGGVVSISGMPGVGKTAFAIKVAHRLADGFPDGRLFVDLHAHDRGRPAAEPADVLAGLLTLLGMASRAIPDGLENRRAVWRDRTAGKRILLVLDDARDAAQVEPLLPNGPNCATVIAGRRMLVALDGAHSFSLDTLAPDAAAELFCTLARRAPAESERAVAAEIVRLCGYLPLAIVLLAARMAHHPTWTLAGLADDLAAAADPLGEFEAGERAVHIAFGMSYRDMPPARQQLFRRLGLHPARDIDGYAAAALNGTDVAAARRELEALFVDHLLQEHVHGRYRMHDLLRTYAHDLAAGDPEPDRRAAVERLLNYYWHVGYSAGKRLAVGTRSRPPSGERDFEGAPSFPGRDGALAWLRAERDNLLDCLGYAARCDRPRQAIGLTSVLAGLLFLDGPWPVAVELHQRAVALARLVGDRLGAADAHYNLGMMRYAIGDYPDAVGPMREALRLYSDDGRRVDQARVFGVLGALAYVTGDYPGTADLMRQARTIYQDEGDRSAEAYALIGMGMARYATGDYRDAAQWVQQALTTFADVGDPLGEAHALNELGEVRYASGDYPGATESVERALAVYRAQGDRFAEARARNDLASVRFATGDYPGAADSAWQALEICRDLGDRMGEAYALTGLARLHYATADWSSAVDDMNRALEIFREIGDRVGEAYAVNDLGWARYTNADYSGTVAEISRALAMFSDIGDRVGQAYTLLGLGLVRYADGEYVVAAEPMRQALTIFDEIGDRVGRAYVLAGLGRLALATGDHPAAADRLGRALEIFEAIGDAVGAAYVLSSMGRLGFDTGDTAGAVDLVTRAVATYREIGDRFGFAYALAGLALLRYAEGDYASAIGPATEAADVFHDIGDRVCYAYAFVGLGLLRYADGDLAGAVAMVERAPALFREIGDRIGEAYAFVGASLLSYKAGDYDRIDNMAQQGLALFRAIGENPRRAELLERLTTAWEESSKPQDAVVSYADALRLIREIQIRWKKRRVWRDWPVPVTRR